MITAVNKCNHTTSGEIACRLVAVLLLLLLSTSCTDAYQKPLRIGTNKWIGYEPLYLAEQQGLINKADFKLIEMASASQVAKAIEQGLLDMGAFTLDEAMRLVQGGDKYQIVLITDYSYGGDAIMSRAEYPNLASLVGKRIGLEDDAVSDYLFYRATQLANLDYNAFTIVPLHVNQHLQAFDSGTIDAVATFEPFRTYIQNSGAIEIFSSKQIPEEIVDVLVIRKSLLSDYHQHLPKVMNAWFTAVDLIAKRDAGAITFLARRSGVNRDELLSMLNTIKFPSKAQNTKMLYGKSPTLSNQIERISNFLKAQSVILDATKSQKLLQPTAYWPVL